MKSESELRQPELQLTRTDFVACDWRSPLVATERDGYSSMRDAFLAAASRTFASHERKAAKVFWLLSSACSMMLRPASVNEPFKPLFVLEGQRSIIADDFQKEELAFFAEIVDDIDDPWLRARLADIVWLTSDVRDVRFALLAIDAYRLIPLSLESWIRGGEHCWARAISLAKLLKSGAGDQLKKIEESVITALKAAGSADGFLALWLAEMLAADGMARHCSLDIADKLQEIADDFRHAGESLRARGYYKGASDWYRTARADDKSADMLVEVAESFVGEARSKASSDTPINILAASHYEDAIQAYRQIPRALRGVWSPPRQKHHSTTARRRVPAPRFVRSSWSAH